MLCREEWRPQMNKYESKKYTFVALVLGLALSSTQMTHPIFDWLDNLRDKLSAPIMGKVTKAQDKPTPLQQPVNRVNHQPNRQNRRKIIKNQATRPVVQVTQPVVAETQPEKAPTPIALDIAEMLTQVYCTEGIETPINRIGVSATIKTGFSWFGRKISSHQALSTLAKDVLISSVMFSVHNLAAYFLYPNWLKDRFWMKGFANSLCSSMVMGFASTVFGTTSE